MVLGTLYWLFPLILGNTLKQVAILILQTRKWNLREVKQLSNFIQRRSEQAGFELGSLCLQAQQCSEVCPLSVGVQRGWRERHTCGCSCHVTTLEGPSRTILLLKEDRKQVRDEGTDRQTWERKVQLKQEREWKIVDYSHAVQEAPHTRSVVQCVH